MKKKLRDGEAPFEKRIAEIKEELEKDIPVSQKESLATESDKLVKDEDAEIEKLLNEILPEAFAIMKSTARRFAQNPVVEVTASDFDRQLSISHDFVTIEGDKALWKNHWIAGGNEVTWDMVHYNVQLIGGIILHQGKIAEMATIRDDTRSPASLRWRQVCRWRPSARWASSTAMFLLMPLQVAPALVRNQVPLPISHGATTT